MTAISIIWNELIEDTLGSSMNVQTVSIYVDESIEYSFVSIRAMIRMLGESVAEVHKER